MNENNYENNKTRWLSLQPLTGGMYLGFRNALGCDAEAIISYKGLCDYTPSRTPNSKGKCSNEWHLVKYLEKIGATVPRYEFANDMFDEIAIYNGDVSSFMDLDVICAVPVCSGLSVLTGANVDKDHKNANMKALARFALSLRPKVYIFENAPGFMSDKAADLRRFFEELARDNGYSVAYFKTDTRFHHNCQRRPRTFVMMVQYNGNESQSVPDIGDLFEDVQLTPMQVFDSIHSDAPGQDILPDPLYENVVYMQYVIDCYPNNWREWLKGDVMNNIIRNNKLDHFRDYCERRKIYPNHPSSYYERMVRHIDHVCECMEMGKGWWSAGPTWYGDTHMPAIQSRTVFSTVHPSLPRLCSEREMLTLMGMPSDFELQGDFMKTGRQIGQNVPVKTAEWIARIASRMVEHIDDTSRTADPNVIMYYDNTTKKTHKFIYNQV